QRHPHVEQDVVQRWMSIVTKRRGDVADRQPRDVDAQCLVEPKVRSGPEAQDQSGRDRTGDGHELDRSKGRVARVPTRTGARWHEILPDGDFLMRPRMSRIYYDGKYLDYPLRLFNVLRSVGVLESFRCVFSYIWIRIHPPKDLTTFEGWTASRFGWRLYRMFF